MKTNSNSGVLLASRNDGLGARLMVIINAMRLSQDFGIPFKIYWSITDGSRPEVRNPEELFSAEFIEQYFIDPEEYKTIFAKANEFENLLSLKSQDQLIDFMNAGNDVMISNTSRSRYSLPWEDRQTVAQRIAEVFRTLPWHQTVLENIDRILEVMGGQSPTAYHIRRGDITNRETVASDKLWPTKYFPREFYETHLADRAAKGGGKILVFTDEPREVAKMQAISDLALEIDDIVDRNALTWCQYDFLSLFAMSLCQPIFGPSGSGFSETAAVIGNTQVLDIQAQLPRDLRTVALTTLVDRLENDPDNFFSFEDIGQNFPFAYDFLSQTGETSRAAQIIRGYLDQGMDRSYAYEMLSSHYLKYGAFQDVVDLLKEAQASKNLSDLAMAVLLTHSASAYQALDNIEKSGQMIRQSFWLHPKSRIVERPIVHLANIGILNDANFFPIDKSLSRPAKLTTDTKGIMFPIDPIVRDWKILLGKRVGQKFMTQDFIDLRLERALTNFKKSSTNAAVQSLRGLYAFESKDYEKAAKFHKKALNKEANNPLYLKRLADVLAMQPEGLPDAISTMEQAVEQSGFQICYVAVLAILYVKNKQRDASIKLWLDHGHKAAPFPEVEYFASQHLSWDEEHHDLAVQYFDNVMAKCNENKRFLNVASNLFYRTGNLERALEILEQIEHNGTLNVNTEKRLAELRETLGRVA